MAPRKEPPDRGQVAGQQLRPTLLAGLFLAVCLVAGGVRSTLRTPATLAAGGGSSGVLNSARPWRLGSRRSSLMGGSYPPQGAGPEVLGAKEGSVLLDGGEGRDRFSREKLPFTADEAVQQQRPQHAAAAGVALGWGQAAQLLGGGGVEGEPLSTAADGVLLPGGEASARVARHQLPFAEDWEGGASRSAGSSGSGSQSAGFGSRGGVGLEDRDGEGGEAVFSGEEAQQGGSGGEESEVGGCRRLLWITAVGEVRSQDSELYLKAALVSARQHAPSLIPVLLHGGSAQPHNLTRWYTEGGGAVVRYQPSFLSALQSVNDMEWRDVLVAQQGAYLWMAIPQVVEHIQHERLVDLVNASTHYALYTEPSVLFLGGGLGQPPGDVSTCTVPLPRLLALGSESKPGLASSTGVLLLNLTSLAHDLPALLRFGEEIGFRSDAFNESGGNGVEGLVLEWARASNRSLVALPDRLDWKPYWGSHPQATILRWHGPKPCRDLPCFLLHRNQSDWEPRCATMPPEHVSLLRQAQEADGGEMYARMMAKLRIYLQQAEGDPGRGPRRRRQHEQGEGGLGRK